MTYTHVKIIRGSNLFRLYDIDKLNNEIKEHIEQEELDGYQLSSLVIEPSDISKISLVTIITTKTEGIRL